MSKIKIFLLFTAYVLISHFIIPEFNEGSDLLFFTKFELFAGAPQIRARDISCDGGKSFLFRDYRKKLNGLGPEGRFVFNLMDTGKYAQITEQFSARLKELLSCESLEVLEVENTFFEHMFKTKPTGRIVERTPL